MLTFMCVYGWVDKPRERESFKSTTFYLNNLQVFVSNSARYSDIGHAFGYLKASTNLSCVNLFVMPYNYPILLPLLGK